MTEPEIYAELNRILRQLFKIPAFVAVAETGLNQIPGWNSLMLINIIVAIENTFGIEIASADGSRARSVGDFAHLILARQLQPAANS